MDTLIANQLVGEMRDKTKAIDQKMTDLDHRLKIFETLEQESVMWFNATHDFYSAVSQIKGRKETKRSKIRFFKSFAARSTNTNILGLCCSSMFLCGILDCLNQLLKFK